MKITEYALTKRTVMTVLLVLALVAGTMTYFTLPRQEDPGFTIRVAVVTAFYPGATPQEVEQLVTDPLEEEIEEIPQIEFIESESRSGASVIQVEVRDEFSEVEPVWDELRERVQDAASNLPKGVVGPNVNDNFGDRYSTIVAMTGDGFSFAELETISEEVRKNLLALNDVAKVEVMGLPQKRVFVEYEPSRLAALGLSARQLTGILQRRNVIADGGYVQNDRERFEMRPTGSFDSVASIRSMTFTLPNSDELIALQDVASVVRGYADPPTRNVHYNGERAVSIAVSMEDGGKITQLGPRLLNNLQDMETTLPAGIDFHTVSYRASVVDRLVNEFTGSLLQGILAVLAVMLLFLGVRTGTIVATAIPTTIIGSLLFMAFFDISLNKMSLTALIIALGLLVDNAIVMSESILVQMREGKRAFDAAVDSVKELRFPLLVASLTTAAALLPTYLSDHVVAEYTSAIFEVVTIALLFSWGLSLTVMPMLCFLFLKVKGEDVEPSAEEVEEWAERIRWYKPSTWPVFNGRSPAKKTDAQEHWWTSLLPSSSGDGAPVSPVSGDATVSASDGTSDDGTSDDGEYDTPFYRWYRRFVLGIVRHRWVALGTAVAILGTAIWAAGFLPKQFIPRKEETIFRGELEMPYGTPFERTEAVVSDLETFMRDSLQVDAPADRDPLWTVPTIADTEYDQQGILNWGAWIGSGAPRYILGYNPEQPRPNYAYFLVNTTSYEVQKQVLARVNGYLERTYPEATPSLEKLRNGPPLDAPIEVRLSGNDLRSLQAIADNLKAKLREVNGVVNVSDDWGKPVKRVRVDIDDTRAQQAGLTSEDVATSIRTNLTGVPLTEYREGNDLIPVVLRSTQATDRSVSALSGIDVVSQSTGTAVPLLQVAALDVGFERAKILRRDRKRTITVQAELAPNVPTTITPFSVIEQVKPWLEEQRQTWPFGYSYGIGGEPEQSGDAQGGIRDKAPFAVLFIILLLVAQFNSIRKPLIVLLTLPFALIGVVSGLYVTNLPLDFMGLLGVIALFGILINNAVVLIDRIEIEMDDFGRSPPEAVLQASQRRLRPILLTTATTIGGLLPLWITGDVMFTPMAVSMIFGLLFATFLTLGLVPLLYALFYRLDFDHLSAQTAGLQASTPTSNPSSVSQQAPASSSENAAAPASAPSDG